MRLDMQAVGVLVNELRANNQAPLICFFNVILPRAASNLNKAKLDLGRAMHKARIYDFEETGAKLRALDGAPLGRTTTAKRNRLLKQLAEAALEDDAPLPGAEQEYQRARALMN